MLFFYIIHNKMIIFLRNNLLLTITKYRYQKVKADFCEKVCLCNNLRSN